MIGHPSRKISLPPNTVSALAHFLHLLTPPVLDPNLPLFCCPCFTPNLPFPNTSLRASLLERENIYLAEILLYISKVHYQHQSYIIIRPMIQYYLFYQNAVVLKHSAEKKTSLLIDFRSRKRVWIKDEDIQCVQNDLKNCFRKMVFLFRMLENSLSGVQNSIGFFSWIGHNFLRQLDYFLG